MATDTLEFEVFLTGSQASESLLESETTRVRFLLSEAMVPTVLGNPWKKKKLPVNFQDQPLTKISLIFVSGFESCHEG